MHPEIASLADKLPVGQYLGTWSGYVMTFPRLSGVEIRTRNGIRGAAKVSLFVEENGRVFARVFGKALSMPLHTVDESEHSARLLHEALTAVDALSQHLENVADQRYYDVNKAWRILRGLYP
jgi:hypothetical protein